MSDRKRTYAAWYNMHMRCSADATGANKERYFDRGIRITPRWADFDAFLSDMGLCPAGLTLERIDNDGSYQPDNCRWATRTEQARNRRNNISATVDGVSLNGLDWSRRLGVSRNAFYTRARRDGCEAAVRHYLTHGVRSVKGKNT